MALRTVPDQSKCIILEVLLGKAIRPVVAQEYEDGLETEELKA